MMERFPIEKISPIEPRPPQLPTPEIPGLGQALVIAEELAMEIGEEVAKRLPKPTAFKTHILERANQRVRPGKFNIFKVQQAGSIDEFLLVADSANFALNIMADSIHIKDNWSELHKYSYYVGYFSAWEADGAYVVHFTDIPFRNRLEIFISAAEELTLTKLLLKAKLETTELGRIVP